MATHYSNIDVNKLIFGDIETGRNGGKYMPLSYEGNQFKNVQLGESVYDTLRCPFGYEAVSQERPNQYCIKVEVSDKLKSFIESIDASVKKAVNNDSLFHRSTLREGNMSTTLKIKLMPDTEIFIATLENNKISPKKSSITEITPNSQIIPIIKIQGGVYFIEENYGTSIVATQILIVQGIKNEAEFSFSLGNDITVL